MGLFGPSKPKYRITKQEFEQIRRSLFDDLKRDEWAEVERVFFGHLQESGIHEGIDEKEFKQGMATLRADLKHSRLEPSDLDAIEQEFQKHIRE